VANLASAASSVVIGYSSGPAFADIGYYFYLFFVFWDIFEGVFIYFFFAETKDRTLEEMNEIFVSDLVSILDMRPFTDCLITGGKEPGQEESREAQHRDGVEYCPCAYHGDGIGRFRNAASLCSVMDVVIHLVSLLGWYWPYLKCKNNNLIYLYLYRYPFLCRSIMLVEESRCPGHGVLVDTPVIQAISDRTLWFGSLDLVALLTFQLLEQ
jgi:hypothetical protein